MMRTVSSMMSYSFQKLYELTKVQEHFKDYEGNKDHVLTQELMNYSVMTTGLDILTECNLV